MNLKLFGNFNIVSIKWRKEEKSSLFFISIENAKMITMGLVGEEKKEIE